MLKSIGVDTGRYITSIDGLRALAILLVLFFHVDFAFLQGGFIGVDIFFVISGFLITSNILRDLNAGRWRFLRFYLRRIARLLPALFSVIILTAVLSYYLLSPDDLIRFSKVSAFTTFSLSNFFFYSESGYFDGSASTKPLLHTWSLSVEEQFYLIWPLLLVVIFRVRSKAFLTFSLVLVALLSISAALYMNRINPEMVFYFTPFRAYQFCFGALIAVTDFSRFRDGFILPLIGLFSVLGIIALSAKVSGSSHLMLAAILPALAAAGFIVASETRVIMSLFSSKPMVWIGQRSYSIYLVHWPIVVFWKMQTGSTFGMHEQAAIILLSITLGYFLHRYIEQPFRLTNQSKAASPKRSYIVILILLLCIILLSFTYWKNKGFPERVSNEMVVSASNLGPRWVARQKQLRTGKCNILIESLGNQQVSDYDINLCLDPLGKKPAYLVIGDSFASGAYLLFSKAYPEVYFGQLTIPGCRLISSEKIANKVCAALYKNILGSQILKEKYQGVIIASDWKYKDMADIDAMVGGLLDEGKEVIMVGQRIRFEMALPKIVLQSMNFDDAHERANTRMLNAQFSLNAALKKKFSGKIHFVDLISIQCPDECDVFTASNKIVYLDNAHLSLEGVSLLSKRLREYEGNLFNLRLDDI